jgi:hypothetical protein
MTLMQIMKHLDKYRLLRTAIHITTLDVKKNRSKYIKKRKKVKIDHGSVLNVILPINLG